MGVRAKMRCVEVSERTSVTGAGLVEAKYIRLQAVYGGDDDKENRDWSKWTPSGELAMTVTNPDAFNQFKIGKCYFIDMNEVIVGPVK